MRGKSSHAVGEASIKSLLFRSSLLLLSLFLAGANVARGQNFGVYRELWTGLNPGVGNSLAALTNTTYNPNWPNNPNAVYTTIYNIFEPTANIGLDYYGERLRAFIVPPTNGNYPFW